MSFRAVILNAEGIKQLGKAINGRGGSLEEISEKTGVSSSTINNLLAKKPLPENTVKITLSALSIDFDKSLVTEAVEARVNETRRELEKRKLERANREMVLRFLAGAKRERSAREQALQNQIIVDDATEELSEISVDDVQGIASTQLRILDSY